MAAVSMAVYRGREEVGPHETIVGGLKAAEWVTRYTLVETGGSHAMKVRSIIIALRDNFWVIGFSGPATDRDDFEAFEKVVQSIHFSK